MRAPHTGKRPLWQALRPLYLRGPNPYPPVVALAAYFDESNNKGIHAVAGYVGAVDMWDNAFAPAWREAIDAAGVRVSMLRGEDRRLSEFKASDCRSQYDEFADWPRDERDAITRSLVDVLVDPAHEVFGVGAAVIYDYARLGSAEELAALGIGPLDESNDPDFYKKLESFGYFWSFFMVMVATLRLARPIIGDDTVHFVFDQKKGFEGRAGEAFRAARDRFAQTFPDRVRGPSFEASDKIQALQAADLLAHETYKELLNRSAQPAREPSRALVRLVEGKRHLASYIHWHDLLSELPALQKGGGRVFSPPLVYGSERVGRIYRP
jgi:hypothetical protein